ncbi:hypothetical protein N657DRAFT_221102 [Parathielavia appendiculata]|uniref:Uncharacterized protein n=1 Tax=Parathielavia appendiculata TaxID=2587402 RepID=A0AAN6U7M0_9PEZI|nr:hypothetical protein N657DRAFT_221102 [Parathielavia appendiculata]
MQSFNLAVGNFILECCLLTGQEQRHCPGESPSLTKRRDKQAGTPLFRYFHLCYGRNTQRTKKTSRHILSVKPFKVRRTDMTRLSLGRNGAQPTSDRQQDTFIRGAVYYQRWRDHREGLEAIEAITVTASTSTIAMECMDTAMAMSLAGIRAAAGTTAVSRIGMETEKALVRTTAMVGIKPAATSAT